MVDLSRAAFDPRKRYAGVRMQQGRVTLDDDFNESERIDDEEERRSLLDVIGPAGTPDDGFRIENGHMGPTGLTFDIGAGTMYLGGLRVWNPDLVDFATQPDWLQQPASERALPDDGRIDLVYLETWRQGVTAVEDAELFEAALAGPDTSARVRQMWRVRLAPNLSATDCKTAWEELIASWEAAGLGAVQPSGERTVDAELTVGLEPGGPAGDLCSPPVAGGYLGAENQAIRVELVGATHFVWGFNNAAPLYRVKVGADAVTITLDTEPKDQAHWPLAGQIVEILPWSAVLPNGEKLAELAGHLSRVAGSYDPESRTITLATAVPAGFGEEWTTRVDAGTLAPTTEDRHDYMRVWDRGDDQTSPVSIPFVAGTPVPLGSTGLNVTFEGTEFVTSDHWIISARPETPDQVVPWSLEVGRGPNGMRRFFTPLALVQWQGGADDLTFDLLSDCRKRFLPLTRLRTCCTYTVGDEKQSFGMFKSIQDAVNHLPDAGGKICVLPGDYPEQVTIQGRHDVTIEGCGRRTRIIAPERPGQVGVLIVGSQNIAIVDLMIEAGNQVGVLIFDLLGPTPVGTPPTPGLFGPGVLAAAEVPKDRRAHHILLESLVIHATGLPAVAAYGGSHITLRTSSILAGPLPEPLGPGDLGRWPAVVLLSDDVLIEENDITAAPDPVDVANEPTGTPPTFARTAMGGIQLGGGSERVEIRRNRITAGNGDGVTLGSWAWAKANADGNLPEIAVLIKNWIFSPAGWHLIINDEGCIEIVWDPPPPDDDAGQPLVPVSMGDLRDIRIVDNEIIGMGRCGVAVARFFDLEGADEIIRVDRLTIENDRIIGCLRLPIPELPDSMVGEAALGAIALADGEMIVIRDNVIERNGRTHIDPVCGVFSLRASGLSVERNRIVDNAPRTASREPPRPGLRGGVVVMSALPPTVEIAVGETAGLRASGVPAARIFDNIIVVPEGRCLVLLGQGSFSITDNQMTSRGVATANVLPPGGNARSTIEALMDLLGGATVFAVNVGRSNELGNQLVTWVKLSDVEVEPASGLDPTPPILTGGDILLADNQITLDLMERTPVAVLTSLVLLSLDDVLVDSNQMQVEQNLDLVAAQLLGFGWSFRLTGNRIEEALVMNAQLITFGLSALVLAPLGTMTSNQSTHCLLLSAALRVFDDNIQVIQAFDDGACGGTGAAAARFDAKYMKSRS